jgi:hypothetical protein
MLFYTDILFLALPYAQSMTAHELARRLEHEPWRLVEPELALRGLLDGDGALKNETQRAALECAKTHVAAGTDGRAELMRRFGLCARHKPHLLDFNAPRLVTWLLNYWLWRACRTPAFDLAHAFGLKGTGAARERAFASQLVGALVHMMQAGRPPRRGFRNYGDDKLRRWMDEQGARAKAGCMPAHRLAVIERCIENGWTVVNTGKRSKAS